MEGIAESNRRVGAVGGDEYGSPPGERNRREQQHSDDLNSSSLQTASTRREHRRTRRMRKPAMTIAVTTLAALVSTASASSRSAPGGNGSNGGSNSRGRPNTADPRLSRSLRDEAASLANGKQVLNDGLSILGGALDDGDVRRGAAGGYGEEDSGSGPLIDGDDLALLDAIFGSSTPSPSSTKPSAVDESGVFSEEIDAASAANVDAYDEYDDALDDNVGSDLVDDEEIDGLFERAGKLLEAEEGDEVDESLQVYEADEYEQYYDDELEEEEKRSGTVTAEDMLPDQQQQHAGSNTWEDPIDEEYIMYDPYDEYLAAVDGEQEPLVDVDDQWEQWEAGHSQQVSVDDAQYEYDENFEEEFYEDDMPPFQDAAQELAPEEYDEGGFIDEDEANYQQQQPEAYPYDDEDLVAGDAEVVFDVGGGYDEYEYDYTDPTLAMDGDEEFAEAEDEQQFHDNELSQQILNQREEDTTYDTYQQSSNSQPDIDAYLNAAEPQDDEEFDSEFADAAIAAARMEEEEEREFEAEANTENTDNAADFDYIYEDRATLFDEDGFVADGSPKHSHHPVPPVHAADSGIDSIIQAHRISVAKDLGIDASPLGVSSPSLATATGAQQRQKQPHPRGTHTPSSSSDHPRSFGYGHSYSSGGSNRGRSFGGSGSGGGGSPFDDPERIARMEARRQKNERNFRREVSADVHKTYSTAVASVIRGDASPHVPANLFGQSLEEERAGCKLAGLGPEFDRNGMRNGKFCSEEELQTYVEWSTLLHSTYGDQCGAVDVKTAKARLYGGAQYHRTVRCFSALLLTLPLPEITEEELSLLLTASGSAGGGSHGAAGHDGPDLLRTAAILCRTKMEGLVRFALDELAGRVEYILRDRAWECIKYSALVRPASEAGTDATKYGSGISRRGRSRSDISDEAAYRYSDLEEIFKEVARDAYVKFVKKSVAEAAQLGWTDALALLRYVSWDLTMAKPKRKNASSSSTNRYGQSSADIKPIRGGARGEAGLYSNEDSIPKEEAQRPERKITRQGERHRATTVRPVKQSQRQKTRERRAKAAAEKAAKLKKEEEANQGFFSKVRLFRRTKRDENAPLDADVSAYYDLNELYGLDDEVDGNGEMNEEDLGDLVGGVLSRGAVDEERGGQSPGALAARESPSNGQFSSEVVEDGDDNYKLSRTQGMEDDEMLSILLRAAAVAASSNKGGVASSFETQTRAAMGALVRFVTDAWRRDLLSLIVGKFNSFCLLGFHSEFGSFLRQEVEKKLAELEEEAKAKQSRNS